MTARVLLTALLSASLFGMMAVAAAAPPGPSTISIIIDDLGNQRAVGERVLRLPAPVACAILPHTPHAAHLARGAHRVGKEVLLHLPMESVDARATGPGALSAGMPETQLRAILSADLASIPHVSGVNNHMGSLLTMQTQPMDQVMRVLRERGGLFFVDSRTHPRSVAARSAQVHRLPYLSRDVFLDNEQNVAAIERQFEELLRIAKRRGHAVAIGHPYPETLDVLERWLPILGLYRIEVVPLRRALKRPADTIDEPIFLTRAPFDRALRVMHSPQEVNPWRAFLFP